MSLHPKAVPLVLSTPPPGSPVHRKLFSYQEIVDSLERLPGLGA